METQQKTQLTSEGRKVGHTQEVSSTPEAALHETNALLEAFVKLRKTSKKTIFSMI